MYMIVEVSQYVAVASFSEAWIEIIVNMIFDDEMEVASFSEAWIEIDRRNNIWHSCCRLLLGGVD